MAFFKEPKAGRAKLQLKKANTFLTGNYKQKHAIVDKNYHFLKPEPIHDLPPHHELVTKIDNSYLHMMPFEETGKPETKLIRPSKEVYYSGNKGGRKLVKGPSSSNIPEYYKGKYNMPEKTRKQGNILVQAPSGSNIPEYYKGKYNMPAVGTKQGNNLVKMPSGFKIPSNWRKDMVADNMQRKKISSAKILKKKKSGKRRNNKNKNQFKKQTQK